MSQTASPAARNEYIALLRHNPNFRNLWLGLVVSLMGDWFNLIGSATLIAALTGSGVAVGGLFVVRMLAPFLVSPLADVVADRYDRRKILIAADIARALVVLGFLVVRDANLVWLLYVLTALQLGLSGFFEPAKNAILPDIVERRQLGAANALTGVTWSVMLAVGAALGGIVAGQWGVYTSFVVDALTFLLSAFFIAQIRYRSEPSLVSDRSVSAVLRQYVDGLRYLVGEREILMIAMQKGLLSLMVAGGFRVVQVSISEKVFVIGQGGSIGLGIMFMAFGVGTGIAPIVARRFTGDREQSLHNAIALFWLVNGLGMLPIIPLESFLWVNVGTVIRGFGGGVIWVYTTQLLLQKLPDEVRGRVFSTEFAFLTLCSAAAAAWTGAALDSSLQIQGTLWLMFWLNIPPTILWAWWIWRRRRTQVALADAPAKVGD